MTPIIIGKTEPQMGVYTTLCKQALGRTVTRNIEDLRLDTEQKKFMATALEVKSANAKYNDDIASSDQVLRLISYTFAAVLPVQTYYDLLAFRNLNIVGQETIRRNYNIVVVNADLSMWRDAIIEGCNVNQNFDVREFFTAIFELFKGEGLSKIWADYRVSRHSDNTLLLESI